MSSATLTLFFGRRLRGFVFFFQQSTRFCIGIRNQTVDKMPRILITANRFTNAIFQQNIAATAIQKREIKRVKKKKRIEPTQPDIVSTLNDDEHHNHDILNSLVLMYK